MHINLGDSEVLRVDDSGNAHVRLSPQVRDDKGNLLEFAHISVYEIVQETEEALLAELNLDMFGEQSFDVVFDIIKEIKKKLRFELVEGDCEQKADTCDVSVQLDMDNQVIKKALHQIKQKEMYERQKRKAKAARKSYNRKRNKILKDQEEAAERLRRSNERKDFNWQVKIGKSRIKEGWVLINSHGKIISDVFAEIGPIDNNGGAEATIAGTAIKVYLGGVETTILRKAIKVYIDRCGLIIDQETAQVLTREEVIFAEQSKMERKAKYELKYEVSKQYERYKRWKGAGVYERHEWIMTGREEIPLKSDIHFHEEIGIGRVNTQYGWRVLNSAGNLLKAEDVGLMFGCKDVVDSERLYWSFINNMFQPKVAAGRVMDANGWSLINLKGETITTEIFEKIEAFDETRCTAKAKSAHRNFQVLINTQGQIVDERTGAPAGNDYLDVSDIKVDIADEQFKFEYTLPAIASMVEDLFFNRLNNFNSVRKARTSILYIFAWFFPEAFKREIKSAELASISDFKSNLGERVRLMTEEKQKNDGTTPSRVIQSDNWKGELEKRFGQLNEVEVFALEEFWSKLNTCNNYGRSIAISFMDLLLEYRNWFSSLNEADIPWVREHFLWFYQMDAIRCLGDLESFDAEKMKYDEDYNGSKNLQGYSIDLSRVKEFIKQSPRLSNEVFLDGRSIGCMDKEKGDDHLFIFGDDVEKEHLIEVCIVEDDVAVFTVFSKMIGNCRVVRFC